MVWLVTFADTSQKDEQPPWSIMIPWHINIHNLAHAKTGLYHLALACCVQHTLRRNGYPAVCAPRMFATFPAI
jgi:hypothetical protein